MMIEMENGAEYQVMVTGQNRELKKVTSLEW
jgi:hypothetical protein